MQLSPQEYFTIARQIDDPYDSTTYYVRAEIRNARTDALIERVALTARGNNRHSREWQVPADTSGQGFYISIVTSVYTDAGFTTKSERYQDIMNTYLVQTRGLVLGGGSSGGGGWADVDYKKLAEIIDQRLGSALKPIARAIAELPEPNEVDLVPTNKLIGLAIDAINAIEFPEMPDVEKIMKRGVKDIKDSIPEQKEVELKPVLVALKNVADGIERIAPTVSLPSEITDAMRQIQAYIAEQKIQEVRALPTQKPPRGFGFLPPISIRERAKLPKGYEFMGASK